MLSRLDIVCTNSRHVTEKMESIWLNCLGGWLTDSNLFCIQLVCKRWRKDSQALLNLRREKLWFRMKRSLLFEEIIELNPVSELVWISSSKPCYLHVRRMQGHSICTLFIASLQIESDSRPLYLSSYSVSFETKQHRNNINTLWPQQNVQQICTIKDVGSVTLTLEGNTITFSLPDTCDDRITYRELCLSASVAMIYCLDEPETLK